MSEVKRESKQEFWSRVRREGRRAQAEAAWAELSAAGVHKRQAQAALVARFQPTDGSRTRAWPTPDSWTCGRKDGKKPPPDCQVQLERDALWVHGNRDRILEEAPTPGARLLLEVAQKRPGEFLRVYLKCLPGIVGRQKDELEARRERVAERRKAKRRLAEREEARRRAAERELTAAREETRQREEAAKRAIAEENARRQRAEAQKLEQERLPRKQEAERKRSPNGPQPNSAVAATKRNDWEEI